MLDIPQGPPFTIFDWLIIREQVRDQLKGLDEEILTTVYGLSHLEGYEDPELCQKVDDLVEQETNPVRSRYFLAVALASYFWEWYTLWGWEVVPEGKEPERDYVVFTKEDSSKGFRQRIKKGEPGWVPENLSEIQQKAFHWLIEGYQANLDDEEVIQEMFNIAARIEYGDCLFDRENLRIMQEVTKRDLSFKSNIYAQEIVNKLKDVLDQNTADNASEETEQESKD